MRKQHTKIFVSFVALFMLSEAGCQQAPLDQVSDDFGGSRVQSIAGNLLYVEALTITMPADAAAQPWSLLEHLADTMTYTHSDGAVTVDGTMQGSTDQGQTSSPVQTTETDAAVDLGPGL